MLRLRDAADVGPAGAMAIARVRMSMPLRAFPFFSLLLANFRVGLNVRVILKPHSMANLVLFTGVEGEHQCGLPGLAIQQRL